MNSKSWINLEELEVVSNIEEVVGLGQMIQDQDEIHILNMKEEEILVEIPSTSSLPKRDIKKRNSLTIEKKIEIIQRHEKGSKLFAVLTLC